TSHDFMAENNQLYFVVTLKDTVKGTIRHTIINIPSRRLKRFYVLSALDDMKYVIFIDDIIRETMGMLFPGLHIESIYSFKLNRDAEMELLQDEYSKNLLDKIEKQLSERDYGEASRFLYEKGMPVNLQLYLASKFHVNVSDMFEGGHYHNLSDLFTFPVFDKALQYRPFRQITLAATYNGDIFNSITQKDILLHLPYHSYTPVLAFFNQAAVDADVTHIYITLYRVAAESHIVNALISAAKNGKKVTAFIELKAR